MRHFKSRDCPKLTSLEGAPEKVEGDFCISNLLIKTLEGTPKIINGDFVCSNCNLLTPLNGISKNIQGKVVFKNCGKEITYIDYINYKK